MAAGGAHHTDLPNLGFSFRLAGGSGTLSLREQRLFDWLYVDRLDLEVPNLPLPVDLAAAPPRFQRRRTRVTLATLRMHQGDVDRFIASRERALGSAGIDELQARPRDGFVWLSGRVRAADHAADFTARVYLHGRGGRLRLIAADACLYGFAGVPAPLVAHRALAALLGDAARARGLGDFDFEPLRALLWHTLPARGWRLPDASTVEIVAARATRGVVEVAYAAGGGGPARGASDRTLAEAAGYVDALRRLRDGDEYLMCGDVDSALRAYRAALARGDDPHVAARALAAAAARPAWFRDAVELAAEALARWPGFAPACAARAAVAMAEGDLREAATWFERLADTAAAAGDDDVTAHAALAGARALRAVDPAAATALYERALAHRPGLTEAVEALASRYEEEERWHDLVRLIRTRIATTSDRARQASELVRLAVILRDALGDTARARDELERATQLSPDCIPAWEALADTLLGAGDVPLAVRALDAAAERYRTLGDARGEARAHLRAAEAWRTEGDADRAAERLARALECDGDYPPAVEAAARAAFDAGRPAEAAALWQRRLELGGAAADARAAMLVELGRSLAAAGDVDAAREALDEAASARAGEPSARAWAERAALDASAGRGDAAATGYARAIDELASTPDALDRLPAAGRRLAARWSLARAHLTRDDRDFERAHTLDPDGDVGRAAARALYESAIARGDDAAARRWLDALVTEGIEPVDELEARLARAEIALRLGDPDAALIDLERATHGALADCATEAHRERALAIEAELARAAGDPLARAKALGQRADSIASRGAGDALSAFADAAEAWLDADDPAEALSYARRAAVFAEGVDDAASAERALRALGCAAWRRRAWSDVAAAAARLLAGDPPPDDAAVWSYRMGVALDKCGDLPGAAAALQRAVDDPGAPPEVLGDGLRALAAIWDRLGEPERSARALERFAAGDVASAAARADAWYRAGEIHRKRPGGDPADAERCFEAALRLMPDHMPSLDGLERLSSERGDWERVAQILGRKIAATPRQAERQKALLARLAELQAERLGRPDVALETHRRALELDPYFRPALRFVAAAARAAGRVDEAIGALEKLTRVLPDDGELDDPPAAVDAERIDAAVALAELLIDRGRPRDAIEPLSTLADRCNRDGRLLDALSAAYRAADMWREAADVLGERAATAGDPAVAAQCDLQRIAIYRSHLADDGAAWAACRAALARGADHPALLAAAVDLSRAHGDPQERVEVLVRAAASEAACERVGAGAADLLVEAADLCAGAAGDPERAAALYRQALAIDPRHPAALSGLGDTGLHARVPEAIEDESLSDAIDAARAHFEDGDPEAALQLIAGADAATAPRSLIELRADVYEALERWADLAADLDALCARAAADGDRAAEQRATRRLAAVLLDRLHDHAAAADRYRRALDLDPDDLAAAEALAELGRRRRQRDAQVDALERVLAICRRTGAGPAREAAVLRELAACARADGALDRAAALLDEARGIAPGDPDVLRARAEVAAAVEDFATCAECLEALANRLLDGPATAAGRAAAGEVLTELAAVCADRLADRERARAALRRAADAFGPNARGDAARRLLAAHALGDEADDEVVAALDAIPADRRTQQDIIHMAMALRRLGHDRRAVAELERARARAPLPDDAAMLLFALHRELARKQQLAESLVRGAADCDPAAARTRLYEALLLYEQSLEDADAAARIRAQLDSLAPTFHPARPAGANAPRDARTGASDGGAGATDARPAAPDPGRDGDAGATDARPAAPDADRDGDAGASDARPAAPDADLEHMLERARALEDGGNLDAAIGQYELASAAHPTDDRPLAALERIYGARGDTDALTEVLGRRIVAAASGRDRAQLWYRRAKLYRDVLHREPETYRCLKEAHANDPTDRDIAYALRSVAMARGEWALAAELLYREIDSAPTDVEAAALHLELAMIYDEKLFDAGQARVNYEQALALDPDIPAAPAPLARLYELAGRHEDAALMGERAAHHARTDDERSHMLRRAGACAERAGKKELARRLYGLAALYAANAADSDAAHASAARVGVAPDDWAAHAELLEMRVRETVDPDEQRDLRHRLLDQAVAAGDAAAIRRHAGELLERDGGDLAAFVALKRAASAAGDWSVVANVLRTRASAIDDRVERAALLYELGRLYLDRLDDSGGAITALEQALHADPNHPGALEALADLAYHKTDWVRARELYARLRPESCSLPPDVLAYRRGEIAEALADIDEAAAAYAEAVRLCPSNRIALSALARAALQLGDIDTAVDASRALVDLMPPDDVAGVVAARMQVAELSRRAGRVADAIDHYEAVLAEQPDHVAALEPLAEMYEQAERWADLTRTLSALAAAAASPAERATIEYRIGEIYRAQLGDPEHAAEAYLRAIDLDPTSAPTQRRLVDHYVAAGDLASAAEMVRELDARDALLSPETGQSTLARAAVVAGATGDRGLAIRIADRIGDAGVLAAALLQVARGDRGRIPALAALVEDLQRAQCAIRRADLVAALAAEPADGDGTADALIAALAGG